MEKPGEEEKEESQKFPLVLIHNPTPWISFHEERYSQRFRFLKPWESSMPIKLYLITHGKWVRAMLSTGIHPITHDILQWLPSLQCVVTPSAGYNHIDMAECRRRGIAVANAGNVFSDDAADYAVGLLLDVLRRISASNRYVRGGLWASKVDYPLGSKLGSKRVGIVGLGSIGLEVAKRLEVFGCSISYNSRKKKQTVSFPYYENICDLAAKSDVLVICCSLNNETHHIVNKDVMSAMGKEGVIINVGRGGLVDEEELVRRLMQREIGGAGLDVFVNEPEVPKELFDLDNVVLSPHRAVLTLESFSALQELIIANLEAFFSIKPLLSPVKFE